MNIEVIKNKIMDDNIRVVSFDIFDTLLMRPCIQPTDILKIVGKRCGFDGDFLTMRRIAEAEARKNKCVEDDEISYDDIYRWFKILFDFSDEEIEIFKEVELKVEEEYLYARHEMKTIFEFAVSSGKEVIIVSDIYLDRMFIELVLKKNGYEGYSRIYLSSEYKLCKNTGRLYRLILKEYKNKNILPCEVLHFGDNEKSDINEAKKQGIGTIHVPRTEWIFRNNSKLRILIDNSIINRYSDDTFLLGFAVNRCFDNPFLHYNNDSFFDGNEQRFLNIIIAPLVISYVNMLFKSMSYYEYHNIIIHSKKEMLIERIFNYFIELLNYDVSYKRLEELSNSYGDVLFGYSNEKEYVKKTQIVIANMYLDTKQCYECKDNRVISGVRYGYDTNRDAPQLSSFINKIIGVKSSSQLISNYQIALMYFCRDFLKMFQKDMSYLWFEFTNFNDRYFSFLKSKDDKDRKLVV